MKSLGDTVFFVLVATLLCPALAQANNNLYLPGDAFFPTELTADELARLRAEPAGKRTFGYSSLGGYDGAFCGYAGYGRATIEAVDDQFMQNLATAYEQMRELRPRELVEVERNGEKAQIETNGMRVLFYSPAFEFPKYKLGLRYNEHWVDDTVRFGHGRQYIRLCPLVNDPDAIMLSWRDGPAVAPLEGVFPELEPGGEVGAPLELAATIRGPMKAYSIWTEDLVDYFRLDESLTLVIIDAEAIKTLVWLDGEWTELSDN